MPPPKPIVLDEIGRGTSTFEASRLHVAVAEYLHQAAEDAICNAHHELTEKP
jgi:DNA mismatch repair ATPase MutS